MLSNKTRYFETDGTVKPEALSSNPWLRLLICADQPYWNAERLTKMDEKKQNAVLDYVLRTLDILDEHTELDDADYALVRTVLAWAEVAKAGSAEDRERWLRRGYPLDIHNEASALIYADYCPVRDPQTDPACILIKTHGLAGQYLRGECRLESSKELVPLAKAMGKERFRKLFCVLNECIIRAVDRKIWDKVETKIAELAQIFCVQNAEEPTADSRSVTLAEPATDSRSVTSAELSADPRPVTPAEPAADFRPVNPGSAAFLPELAPAARLQALLPASGIPQPEDISFFAENIFPSYDLWYFQSALEPFGFTGAARICAEAFREAKKHPDLRHLNFKPLADAMYYDYEGKKSVNIYKQRIIERYLQDPAGYEEHVHLDFTVSRISLLAGVTFTPACEKLIDFCVEAERSGLLSYEKSITLLYDTFGFRRDLFDRLNNEEKYLNTMNSAESSTKLSILDYVSGQTVVDVGSGGGVLLDQLEERYPEKTVIGTDISQNVIETLEKRKRENGRAWQAVRHNFVEEPFAYPVDSILFSSIIHEIYSYTDLGNGKFDRTSVEKALHHAAQSLNKGGRIIIRDGIKTPGSGRLKICFKTDEGFGFFEQFLKDFRGMDMLSAEEKCSLKDPVKKIVVTDVNFGREFLYTYTWGAESFPHEVQECFGYFCLEDFEELFRKEGMTLLRADSFLEPGYRDHLAPLVELYSIEPDGQETPAEFPDSNCIIVAAK